MRRFIRRAVFEKVAFGALVALPVFATASVATAQDARQNFPQQSVMSPAGVDMQSGHYRETGVEFMIGPLTVDHDLEPRIRGANDGSRERQHYATSLSGTSWGFSGPGTNDQYVMLGGMQIKFHVTGTDGSFFPMDSANVGWKMVRSGTDFILTNKSGESYVLSPVPGLPSNSSERRLTSKSSADGHKIIYSYDSSNRLKLVTSNRGYGVVLDYGTGTVTACGYNTTAQELSIGSTCAAAQMKAVYGVDGAGKVTSITDPTNATRTFRYDASNRLSCVTLPNSGSCRVTLEYGTANPDESPPRADQVVRLTTANSEVWTFDYNNVENFPTDYTPYYGEIRMSYSSVAGPNGYSAFFRFGNGYLMEASTPVSRETYDYNSNYAWRIGNSGPYYYSLYPSVATMTEGNQVIFTRDLADNTTVRREIPKSNSALPRRGIFWSYPDAYYFADPSICNGPNVLCDKPKLVIDANGKQTDYTHNGTHGGVLTETGPAVDGVRPQKRYSYALRYAWIKSGSGYVQAQSPIWLLASESLCKTSATTEAGCAAGATDQLTTVYDYGPDSGPNNLLLRGVVADQGGLNLRTCYLYDTYGRRISETQPAAAVAACP